MKDVKHSKFNFRWSQLTKVILRSLHDVPFARLHNLHKANDKLRPPKHFPIPQPSFNKLFHFPKPFQTALTLAVAERKFEFEHRDLHWGNILIAPTTDKFTEFRFDGKLVKLLTHGVKVTIIDYSLSRMVYDGAVLFDNLARDEELFQSSGDYQFDIYRLMRDRVE